MGSKLLRVKVATYKVATPIKWVKLLITKKKLENPPKDCIIRTAEAKNPPVRWLWFPHQLDLCCHTMSIVHIFTTSMGGKQARDEHGFTYYLNRNHKKVTYWQCSKKGCVARMVSRNSTLMLVGEQLPQYDHTTNLLKKKAKEEEMKVIQKHATLPGTGNKAVVNEIAHSILSSSHTNALYSMSTTNALKLALYREKRKLNPFPPLPKTYQDVMKAVSHPWFPVQHCGWL
jgi:hypothetical protein